MIYTRKTHPNLNPVINGEVAKRCFQVMILDEDKEKFASGATVTGVCTLHVAHAFKEDGIQIRLPYKFEELWVSDILCRVSIQDA